MIWSTSLLVFTFPRTTVFLKKQEDFYSNCYSNCVTVREKFNQSWIRRDPNPLTILSFASFIRMSVVSDFLKNLSRGRKTMDGRYCIGSLSLISAVNNTQHNEDG